MILRHRHQMQYCLYWVTKVTGISLSFIEWQIKISIWPARTYMIYLYSKPHLLFDPLLISLWSHCPGVFYIKKLGMLLPQVAGCMVLSLNSLRTFLKCHLLCATFFWLSYLKIQFPTPIIIIYFPCFNLLVGIDHELTKSVLTLIFPFYCLPLPLGCNLWE